MVLWIKFLQERKILRSKQPNKPVLGGFYVQQRRYVLFVLREGAG